MSNGCNNLLYLQVALETILAREVKWKWNLLHIGPFQVKEFSNAKQIAQEKKEEKKIMKQEIKKTLLTSD